ncbi:MAG: DUF1540 domain-containing protein [bacterium]|nr:DUF1540 domain-containing protein [bacterium]
MTQVRCTVNNCHYWGKNNTCVASAILVTSDSFGADQPHQFDAPLADTLEHTPTETCMETCCKTFHPSGAGQKRADDVSLEG